MSSREDFRLFELARTLPRLRRPQPHCYRRRFRRKDIAVLPFENLSSDAENAYFVAGVQDEIALRSRQDRRPESHQSHFGESVKSGSPRNTREIGQQLGVAYFLEGSIQRSAERLRIHAQLIDTRTDSHAWAQTYDRPVADIFTIQSDIAQRVADQLQAKISEREKASIAPPSNQRSGCKRPLCARLWPSSRGICQST